MSFGIFGLGGQEILILGCMGIGGVVLLGVLLRQAGKSGSSREDRINEELDDLEAENAELRDEVDRLRAEREQRPDGQ